MAPSVVYIRQACVRGWLVRVAMAETQTEEMDEATQTEQTDLTDQTEKTTNVSEGRVPVILWMKQGSPCWNIHRRCFLTASNFGTVLGFNKYKTATQFVEEMAADETEHEQEPTKKEIAAEKRKQRNMQWGKDHEMDGVAEYAIRAGLRLAEEDEVFHQDMDDMPPNDKTIYFPGMVIDTSHRLACSPDGLVGADGCIEVKCPVSGQFYNTIPEHYMAQCMGVMGICRRQWCDFVEWTRSGVRVTRLHFVAERWEAMKADLLAFFLNHMDYYERQRDTFCTDVGKYLTWGDQ